MRVHKHGDVEVTSRVGGSVYYYGIGEWSTSFNHTYTLWKRRAGILVKTVKASYEMNKSDWEFVKSHKTSTTWLYPTKN